MVWLSFLLLPNGFQTHRVLPVCAAAVSFLRPRLFDRAYLHLQVDPWYLSNGIRSRSPTLCYTGRRFPTLQAPKSTASAEIAALWCSERTTVHRVLGSM